MLDSAAAISKVYNFTDNVNHSAYEGNRTGYPAWPFDYDSAATGTDYGNLSKRDNYRWITANALGLGRYDFQIYVFKVTEAISKISQLNVTWEGYGETESGHYTNLSLYNWTGGTWLQVNATDFTASSDSVMNGSIGSGTADFVNATSRQVAAIVLSKRSGTLLWSYQENANVTTCSDSLCDGDWSTFTSTAATSFYMNYTKPARALNTSVWQVKENASQLSQNLSLPQGCWEYNANKLLFRVDTRGNGAVAQHYAYWNCYNGTGYQLLG
ncbi:hypothetical protein COY95_00010, partial [Candidatus Woesearchaeota archaeon CG_4_10_14_0_8_um_filter_47_5]